MDPIEELHQFLQIGARSDLKEIAVKHVLDLTGNIESLELITNSPKTLLAILILTQDTTEIIAKDAMLSLVNISANETGSLKLLDLNLNPENMSLMLKSPNNIVITCLEFIVNCNSKLADASCMVLSNLSRNNSLKVMNLINGNIFLQLDKLVDIFTKKQFNKNGDNLHYLGPVFSNLSQNSEIRNYLMDKKRCVIQRLLPFTEYKESIIRRGGIVATLRNCCFEESYHSWLLSNEVDILPRLLLPLAGNEEFDEEDNDKLPIELQYLPRTKVREPDPDIRIMLLEAITQLCATKKSRQFVRDKNTYVILRELHKWEKDEKVLVACENLVDILIRTEEEIGEDNLNSVEIPEDLVKKFETMS